MLLITFDLALIHDTVCAATLRFFNVRFYFLGDKSCVKSVDFGLECVKYRMP